MAWRARKGAPAIRAWIVGGLAASFAACTLAVSTDGLSGGDGPPPATEAGSDAGDAADARIVDATSDDAASPWLGGSSRCALGAPLLTCEGFEVDAGLWNKPVNVDTTRVARGERSYHVLLPVGDGGRNTEYIATPAKLDFPTRGVFVRAFAYVPSGQPVVDTGLVWLYDGQSGNYEGADIGFSNGKLRMRAVGGNNVVKVSTTSVPIDRWFCVELEVQPTGPQTSAVRAYLDEARIDDITITDGVATAKPDTVEIGIEVQVTPAGKSFDMWLDEVAVDFTRIGCAR